MESVRVTKDEGKRDGAQTRALVRLADVRPFPLKLGGQDSPLADAIKGGAEVGKTVSEPPKHEGHERTAHAIDPERAQTREALLSYTRELFEKGSPEEIIDAYVILIKAIAPQEIMDLIRTLSVRPQNSELTREKVFELAELGLKKLIGKCTQDDIPKLVELLKSLRACRNFENHQRIKLVEIGVNILKDLKFTDQQLVTLYEEMGDAQRAVDIAVKQNPPRLWAIEYLKTKAADATSSTQPTAKKALIEMAKSVLGTETT